MKLLVTGGAGYIGSVVTRMLLDHGHQVTVLDDLRTGHREALAPEATHVELSVHEAARVLTPDAGFDGVLHFAALIAAGESMIKPELYWHTNTVGSLALIDAVRAARVPRMVFSSTAAVYGNPTELPIPETAVKAPTNTYGATKLAVDMALTSEAVAHDLGAVSLRYFNVAGAYLHDGLAIGERHEPETHLIPIALDVAAGRREKLQLFGDDYPTVDGTCVRDYIHVEDLARAHLLALDAATPGRHRIYNLGNGNGFTNRQVVDVVREVTGHPVPVEVAPRREGDPAELVASSALARDELGWTPAKPTLHDMVGDAWAFYREHVGRPA
ncbi:UDP-glucose 4-epimerase GalE [Micromonospora sp. WMMA2032]|uniref:UDP-glucose 4-epimerase n=1 Tax=Micromonospora sediminicola TaxID=946078 RepID=A0A1A9BJ25_9ACTN|nr:MULTISPECIES: UDP-glucose 4-epimerase GalE [Micromonospora]ATO15108.1 UDP-glucose 4-epimerase GalE [Micromonospora sp. WMMA2032]PGH43563.1 UDP-glucose 4-epimerase GalE [Micromonospora sp. WMMA1996]SBT68877.1 UDP-galactose 4-epimerase [Micromonospora sediminicola]